MERKAIEELVGRWLSCAIRDGNVAIFDELLAETVRDNSGGSELLGSESFKSRARAVHEAFSSIEVALDQLLIDGDRIAWRWRLTGTHTGAFAGVAASGRRVTLRGVNFQRVRSEDGRVVEHWTLADFAGLRLSG